MKKLLINLDDDLAKELDRFPNKSELTRQALRLYIEHIQPETLEGLRASYRAIMHKLIDLEAQVVEQDAKLDYIANKVQ